MDKVRVTATIVKPDRSLLGFMLEGKDKYFGGISEEVVQRALTLQQLLAIRFNTSQLRADGSQLLEVGTFKINQLPMMLYDGQNMYPLKNDVTIIQRFIQNNINIGFRVRFADGYETNYKYPQLVGICKWFKPENFVIRTSAKMKSFVSGKTGGVKLEDIPAVVIGDPSTAKKVKTGAEQKNSDINAVLPNGFDLLDIYEFVDSCGGCTIRLRDSSYKAVNVEAFDTNEANGFRDLGIGEVATDRPSFNPGNLNVNCSFKKVGVVQAKNPEGQPINLTTFVHKTKSLFLNGENHIKTLGIAVPQSKEGDFVKALGGSLALEKITEPSVTKPLGQVIDSETLSFFKVDISKLDLLSPTRQNSSVLSETDLTSLLQKRYSLQLLSKFVGAKGGLLKDLKDQLGTDVINKASGKKLFGVYSMMSVAALDLVREAGIDVYTGAFNPSLLADAKVAATKTVQPAGVEEISIEYILDGCDASKLTGKKILAYAMSDSLEDRKKLPDDVVETVRKIMTIENKADQLNAAVALNKSVYAQMEKLNKILWMHNTSMFLMGGKKNIYSHNSDSWIRKFDPRTTKGTKYGYMKNDAKGLVVKVSGVSIDTKWAER